MKPGAVLVDIAIDQGGCFEIRGRPPTMSRRSPCTTRVFYCVANMPSAVPKTSTFALTNATMPYVLKLADQGWQAACRSDPALEKGFRRTTGAVVRTSGRRPGFAVHRSGERAGLIGHAC